MLGRSAETASAGWIACVPQGNRAWLALVQRRAGERPAVQWADSDDWSNPSATLNRLRRRDDWPRHPRVALLQRAHYQCLSMEAPTEVPREEWAAAMRWQIKDAVPFNVQDAAVDVLAVSPDASSRGQPQLIAVAAPFEHLRPLIHHAEDAHCPWQAIDVRETALRNLCALFETNGAAQALLHVDESHGTLVVTHGGELLMARQFDITEDMLNSGDEESRQAAFSRFSLDLQRSLDGCERHFSQVTLKQLRVSPMTGVDAVCAQLSELLYVPVARLELSEVMDCSAVPHLADAAAQHAHLCAIGAALRDSDADPKA